MVGMKGYARAVKSLWNGRCTVTAQKNMTDRSTGRTAVEEINILTNEPCRISFDTVTPTATTDNASRIEQRITLYIDPAVAIPQVSKIIVTQNGVTGVYERSGLPAVYTEHQEVPLELFKGWA